MRKHLQTIWSKQSYQEEEQCVYYCSFDEQNGRFGVLKPLIRTQLKAVIPEGDGNFLALTHLDGQDQLVFLPKDEQLLSELQPTNQADQLCYDADRHIAYTLTDKGKLLSAYAITTEKELKPLGSLPLDDVDPTFITLTPDKLLVIGDKHRQRLLIYGVANDRLSFVNQFSSPDERIPYQLIFHQATKVCYLISEHQVIHTLFYDGYGSFEYHASQTDSSIHSTSLIAPSVGATAAHLYHTRPTYPYLSVFEILGDGSLQKLAPISINQEALSLTVTPACSFLILIDQNGTQATSFAINSETGQLRHCDQIHIPKQATCFMLEFMV
ncbi:beta-propeller fold lactonase family protein [Streptococcus entericus]|uniref:beta-propeller fold lactonase family protein n=1 Tax=Streptococcus entericus TaxID=155680 RepID=UPI00037C9711|nr:beta-propeller fold lactonase family protein [Streptococcus entericus]